MKYVCFILNHLYSSKKYKLLYTNYLSYWNKISKDNFIKKLNKKIMKTAIVSVTAIAMFAFYFAIITIAMFVEIGLLSYIFFSSVVRKIKEN
jgi:hypothetical protein